MKHLLLIILFSPLFLSAQVIITKPISLNFGNVLVGNKDSLALTLKNTGDKALNITNLKFYTTYNVYPFSANLTTFQLHAGASKSIWIYFEPEQNILHNSELIIEHNGSSGYTAVDLDGQGVFPMHYYDSTQNKSEEALKVALKARLALGYNQKSYNQARDFMFMQVDNQKVNGLKDSVNTLEGIYTGYKKRNYTSRTDAQTTTPQFNTEHTFPQGYFNKQLPMKSDLHHLFPTTNDANSQRGNKPFGEVKNGTAVTLGGGSFYNSSTFEPRDSQKGRTARAMLYFVIRYQDYSNHFQVQENILRTWHHAFPVDSIDIRRNNAVYAIQGNRNPFIDYPQLEQRITKFVAHSTATPIFDLDILQSSINFGKVINFVPDTFSYVLVNRGNQTIHFSNFNLTNNSYLSFVNGSGLSDSLLPGDAISISIELLTQTNRIISDTLIFNTNISGPLAQLKIPIKGESVTSIDENSLKDKLKVFPNPIENQLFIENNSNQPISFYLLDAQGRKVTPKLQNAIDRKAVLSTKTLPKGVYFLHLSNGKESTVKKIIK